MRVLIISDIHSNESALGAVLMDVGFFDKTICLGDVVGYGPDPETCVSLVRDLPDLTWVMGNHDAAVVDLIDTSLFNQSAQKALNLQRKLLSRRSLEFLKQLPQKTSLEGLTLAHGSPRDPIWEYVDQGLVAWRVFDSFAEEGCLVGHTHTPCIFIESVDFKVSLLKPASSDRWIPCKRFILNPGSVGQPRDGDPRASYVLWDTEENSFLFRRVAYDIDSVIKRIEERGIPLLQAQRLKMGKYGNFINAFSS